MTDAQPQPNEPKPNETPAEQPQNQTPPPADQPTPPPTEAATPPVAPDAAIAATSAPTVETEETPAPTPPPSGLYWGTGRRKSSVARVRLLPGSGKIVINKREVNQYFTQTEHQNDVYAPLELTGLRKQWDVLVNVNGGGITGQAGAVRLGIARAIVKAQHDHEPALRSAGYLTRDAREVERKKYGHRKARRRFQFSKR